MSHSPDPTPESTNAVVRSAIGAEIAVRRALGSGLLESVHERALTTELRWRGHTLQGQVPLDILYRGEVVGTELRLDLVVDEPVVLELESVETPLPIHRAQLLTYLRLSGCRVGLLPNFNVVRMRDGVRRVALQGTRFGRRRLRATRCPSCLRGSDMPVRASQSATGARARRAALRLRSQPARSNVGALGGPR